MCRHGNCLSFPQQVASHGDSTSKRQIRVCATSPATTAEPAHNTAVGLTLHNTMTRRKENFTPLNGNHVSMYVCGVTVYDLSHIGHARVYVAFDLLYRLLLKLGYDVDYVRNFTDIDDKIIKRANEAGI